LADQSEGVAVVSNAGRRAASGRAMDDEDLEAPENPSATRFYIIGCRTEHGRRKVNRLTFGNCC
jgi:hypothetical protein